jgi:hypothetical protein
MAGHTTTAVDTFTVGPTPSSRFVLSHDEERNFPPALLVAGAWKGAVASNPLKRNLFYKPMDRDRLLHQVR